MRTQIAVSAAIVTLIAAGPAWAGTVSGEVDAINELSAQGYVNDIGGTAGAGGASLDDGAIDVKIAEITLSNNYEEGWRLILQSENHGKLLRLSTASSAPGCAATYADEIVYTTVKLVKTGGTLGQNLTDPNGSSINLSGGLGCWDTGYLSVAHSATVDYAADLKISIAADTSLLQGVYSDVLTLTLTVDDDCE